MTNLSTTAIAQLSAVVTGGGFKRAATKADAIKRFLTVAAEKGIDADKANAILASVEPEAELKAALAPTAPTGGAGFERLRRRVDLSALAAATVAEGEKARAKVRATMPKAEKAPAMPRDRAAPAKASEVPAPKASRSKLDTTAKIVAVVENPKKEGSRSHARFALYKVGATVQEFIDACVAAGFPAKEATADLSWDRRHDFIKVEATR